MDFSFDSYNRLIKLLIENDYNISNYESWGETERTAILRHDVDYDMEKAVEFAEFENSIGVKSTYFVLLTSDLYNAFSGKNRRNIQKILSFEHDIGLHFDETTYDSNENIGESILKELHNLECIIEKPVKAISMHRPSKRILEMPPELDGVINSYSELFFREFKYVSDSRRRWRESVEQIISAKTHNRLHILTHPFWYNDVETDLHNSIESFVNGGNFARYQYMKSNFTDLESVMRIEEVR